MTGQQVQIQLNSAMDTDSDDLIKSEVAFRKKNSYLFNGVLSNLTSEKGNGIMSTTGKTITVEPDGIHTGNIVFPLPEDLKTVNDYKSIDSYKDCLFARRLEAGLAYIRRPSATTLYIHTPEAEFGLAADDIVKLHVDDADHNAYPYSINGFIIQNRNTGFDHKNLLLVTKHYYAKDVSRYYNKYEMYNLAGNIIHSWEDEYVYENHPYRVGNVEWSFGDKFTSYVRTKEIDGNVYNFIYWGFDDNDMRRRYLFRTWYYYNPNFNSDSIFNSSEVDEGIDNSNNVDEAIYNQSQFIYSTIETTELYGESVSNLGVLPICRGFGLISDKGYVYGEPLVERIPQNQNPNILRGRGLWNTKTRELANGVLVCEVPNSNVSNKYWAGTTYANDSMSRFAMNNGLGDNPITYNSGAQSGRNNFANTKFTQYVDNDDITSHEYFYNWILSINLNEDENYQMIPAIEDTELLPSGIAHITFMNYSDPIGNFRSNPELDEQVFPHMRFFMNVQEDRGIYWDYGKGWNSMYIDQLYINKYTSYGVAVWETPLSLIYNTAENKFTDNLNIIRHNYDSKYLRLLDHVASETKVKYDPLIQEFELETELAKLTGSSDYPLNDKVKFINESEFQAILNVITPQEGEPYYLSQVFRLHPITAALKSDNAYVNHAWTGFANSSTMGIISHTFDLDEHLQLGVYASIPTALSAYNTLLFTPQDLGDNFSFDINDNGYFITRYSTDSIESVVIKNNATYKDVSVSKLADYEFRTNMLDTKNLIVEDHTGNFSIERAFYPYLMDSVFNNYYPISNPLDSSTPASNGSWYFGAGKNFRLNGDEAETSTFLLAPFVLSIYVVTSETDKFNKLALDNRYGKLISDLWCFGPGDEVDEFYTFNRKTTSVEYKNTRYINEAGIQLSKYKPEYAGTSWWAGALMKKKTL